MSDFARVSRIFRNLFANSIGRIGVVYQSVPGLSDTHDRAVLTLTRDNWCLEATPDFDNVGFNGIWDINLSQMGEYGSYAFRCYFYNNGQRVLMRKSRVWDRAWVPNPQNENILIGLLNNPDTCGDTIELHNECQDMDAQTSWGKTEAGKPQLTLTFSGGTVGGDEIIQDSGNQIFFAGTVEGDKIISNLQRQGFHVVVSGRMTIQVSLAG